LENLKEKTQFEEEPAISFEEKIDNLKKIFSSTTSSEQKYYLLMEMGRNLPPLKEEYKTEENRVHGCQSKLYLHSYASQGKIFFEASADALISAGLAALLIAIYNRQTPETILKRPPQFLHELGIYTSLSPSRSNGLSQIHLRMQKDALKFILNKKI